MKKILIACTALALLAPAAALAQEAPLTSQVEKQAPAHKGKALHRQNRHHKAGEECTCKDKKHCKCSEHGSKHRTAAEREAWKKEHKGQMPRHAMGHGKVTKEAAPAN